MHSNENGRSPIPRTSLLPRTNPLSSTIAWGMLHNNRLNGGLVRSNNLLDLLAILEEYKCWHSSHFQLRGNLGMLVDIDFVEACVGVGL